MILIRDTSPLKSSRIYDPDQPTPRSQAGFIPGGLPRGHNQSRGRRLLRPSAGLARCCRRPSSELPRRTGWRARSSCSPRGTHWRNSRGHAAGVLRQRLAKTAAQTPAERLTHPAERAPGGHSLLPGQRATPGKGPRRAPVADPGCCLPRMPPPLRPWFCSRRRTSFGCAGHVRRATRG